MLYSLVDTGRAIDRPPATQEQKKHTLRHIIPAKGISHSAKWHKHLQNSTNTVNTNSRNRQLETPIPHLAKNLQQILVSDEVEPRHCRTLFLKKIRECFLAPMFGSTMKGAGNGLGWIYRLASSSIEIHRNEGSNYTRPFPGTLSGKFLHLSRMYREPSDRGSVLTLTPSKGEHLFVRSSQIRRTAGRG